VTPKGPRPGLLMQVFGGLDAKTVTMLAMALLGLAGSGTALKRGADTEQQVVALADSSTAGRDALEARVDSLRVELDALKVRLGGVRVVTRGELAAMRRRATRPWWKLWG
jgi:hypothetical protein